MRPKLTIGLPDHHEQPMTVFPPAPRRSGRAAKKPVAHDELPQPQTPTATGQPPSKAPDSSGEPRRNPKRKANSVTRPQVTLPNELLDAALKPLTVEEIEEWEGWTELESEPAFFNFILNGLGVENVKAQEMFTIDPESLGFLPKPVYGLIFLFQFLPSNDELVDEEDVPDLWFANQTTANACATVALLNIVMNAQDVHLGDKLRDFRDQTRDWCTALRGHYLSANPFIRAIHNSFTRRMDHLNADLFLENEASSAALHKAKKRATSKKGRATANRKQKSTRDYGFHFIAYVPKNGQVWELDGLRAKPHGIGEIGTDDWTSIARPHIEARMLQDEEAQLSFNLIALCRSPVANLSQAIAHALAAIHHLHNRMADNIAFTSLLISEESNTINPHDATMLSEFGLSAESVTRTDVADQIKARIAQVADDAAAAHELYKELSIEAKAAMGEYRAEIMAAAEEEERVKGRKKDYAPALHCWVKKLAEKGVLEDIIRDS